LLRTEWARNALEGYLALFFTRFFGTCVELRAEHPGEPSPPILRDWFALNSVEKSSDVSVRPVGVM